MAEKEGLLAFKLIEDETGEALTSYSGLPLVLETCEALGLAGLVQAAMFGSSSASAATASLSMCRV